MFPSQIPPWRKISAADGAPQYSSSAVFEIPECLVCNLSEVFRSFRLGFPQYPIFVCHCQWAVLGLIDFWLWDHYFVRFGWSDICSFRVFSAFVSGFCGAAGIARSVPRHPAWRTAFPASSTGIRGHQDRRGRETAFVWAALWTPSGGGRQAQAIKSAFRSRTHAQYPCPERPPEGNGRDSYGHQRKQTNRTRRSFNGPSPTRSHSKQWTPVQFVDLNIDGGEIQLLHPFRLDLNAIKTGLPQVQPVR